MIIVKDETIRHNFEDENGVEDPDSYFVVRTELPYEGYMEYMDAAISFEMNEEGGLASESSKLKLSNIQEILLRNGLISIVGIIDAGGQPITDWHRLPTYLLGQILKAIQASAKKTKVGSPNSEGPSDAS